MPDKFGKDVLEAHNRYRSLHQVPQLKWSRALEKDAERWAKQLAKEGRLRHEDSDDGENVYAVSGKADVTGGEVVDRWYSEVDNYNFRAPGFKSGTGHFTQIVWQESKELGIGKAKDADGKIFVVARYRPPGNVINHFEGNVKPKMGSSVTYTYSDRGRDTRDFPARSEPKREIFKREADDFRRNPRRDFDNDRGSPRRDFDDARGGPRRQQTETVTTYDRDGKKTTVTRTITDGGGGRGDSFDKFSRDMRSSFDDAKPTSSTTSWITQKPKENRSADRFTPSSSSTSSPKGPFPKQALDAHNRCRSMHGVPPLKWADDLAREAQGWAEKLARARTLQHSSKGERKDNGENIAMFSNKFESAGEEATNMWYEEVKDYNFRRGGWQGGTGHFTQIVWKDSKELGMGRAKTSDGSLTFVVGRYRPAGNVINYMADNVFPKKGR